MKKQEGKVAYITGGTKGIGYGIAEELLAAGMKVGFTGRKNEDVRRVEEELHTKYEGAEVLGIVSDVRSLEAEEQAAAKMREKFGQVDLVVANAGVGVFKSIEDLEAEEWKACINTNVTGVFHTSKAFVPALLESKGYLITIASLAGVNFFARGAAYNASKFAVVGFTQAVMLDLRQDDVKVTTIMPGSVKSEFNGNVPSSVDNWKIGAEDIGLCILQLLEMPARTLPSKIEMRPAKPVKK